MKYIKSNLGNIVLLIVVVLMLVPQTRQPIQVAIQSVISRFNPSVIDEEDQRKVSYSSWELRDLNGVTLNFEDTKGKVVFVNLWATWCPPCIAEFQSIQDLYDDYNESVMFLLVSNESPEVIRKFLDKKGYHIQVFNPISRAPDDLSSKSIPRTFIIDKEGYVVIDKSGAANWNSDKVREQLDKLLLQ